MWIYRRTSEWILLGLAFFLPNDLFSIQAGPEIVVPRNSSVALQDLPWEFHWKRFLYPLEANAEEQAPDLVLQPALVWNNLVVRNEKLSSFGYATYRLRFRANVAHEHLALRLPAPLNSYRIFVNGEKLGEAGTLTESAEKFRGRRKSALFYFTPRTENIEIVIQVANFLTYKGGLRGPIELGYATEMQMIGMRYLATDLFSIGVIFSIMLYHILIYLLSRRHISTLIFGILAFDYFLLAFFFGEQSISLFLPQLPMPVHLRLGSFFVYILPPLVLEFTGRLYQETIPRRIVKIYWAIAGLFLVLLILPPAYFTAYNIFYYGGVSLTAGLVCIWGASQAVRQKRPGAVILLSGLLVLVALTLYAVLLYATHSIAGSFLSIGFSLFALFQSGSLAHNHAALNRQNAEMHLRLERSRMALETQRRQIEANLHDSLGGNLTDIKLGLEALERKSGAGNLRADLKRLDQRVTGTIGSLRTELLFLEDLQLAMKDFVSGINLILLRRYQLAGRKVDIKISPATRESSLQLEKSNALSEETKVELCMVVQELCNNNLKYGHKTATWEIDIRGRKLQISLESPTRTRTKKTGLGHDTLRSRINKIQGDFSERLTGHGYRAQVQLSW